MSRHQRSIARQQAGRCLLHTPSIHRRRRTQSPYHPGYHELAYLHPNRFTPEPDFHGLQAGPRGTISLRFVAWESIHDVGESGLGLKLKRQLISTLSKRGRVVISSENELPAEFEPYRLRIAPEHIHHVLNTSLLIGELNHGLRSSSVGSARFLFKNRSRGQ